ncbi:MAG: PCYCGC domain-containing protein [Anaerolineales bacterium]
MFSKASKFIFLLIVVTLAGAATSACSASSNEVHLAMTPLEEMPMDIQAAPLTVQTAYQFAAANPDLMKQIPCYCGCGAIGHTSNYDCYVAAVDAQGQIAFDNHALGCSICVDITQDVMRLTREGKSPQEIRTAIDATYSKYGPSNIP